MKANQHKSSHQLYAERWLKHMTQSGIVEEKLLFPSILKHLGDQTAKRCFDAGCGNGWTTSLLVDAGATDIIAGDFNPFLLRVGRDLMGDKVDFQIIDLTCSLPFKESSFDTILCKGVFCNMDDESVEKTLNGFGKVAAPGSQLITAIVHPMWHLFVSDTNTCNSFEKLLGKYNKNEKIAVDSLDGVDDYLRFRRPLSWYSRKHAEAGFLHEIEEIFITPFNGILPRYLSRVGFPIFALYLCRRF